MPTLRDYRQAAARKIGPFEDRFATGGGGDTIVDNGHPVRSTIVQSSLFKGFYVHRPNAPDVRDQHRLVRAYAPSTGTLTVSLAWFGAAPTNGEYYELLGVLPADVLNKLVNDTLERCFLEIEVVGSPVVNASRHDISGIAPWIKDQRWIYQVGWLDQNEDRNQSDPFRRTVYGNVERDGEIIYINHPHHTFEVGTDVWIKAIKPAKYHCRSSGGNFGDQEGLILDSDECSVPEEWVAAGVQMLAWDQFTANLSREDEERASGKRTEAALVFTEKTEKFYQEPDRTFVPMPVSHWGPIGGYRRRGWW